MTKRKKLLALTMALLMAISAAACAPQGGSNGGGLTGGVFAVYEETPVNAVPSIAPYAVEPGLANVINAEWFYLTDEAIRMLETNHFVVSESGNAEFFSLYESNRYDRVPNFVTVDAMLHNYHLYFSHLLRSLEKNYLFGELQSLTQAMLRSATAQYEALAGTEWENAAARNVAFFSVAADLAGVSRDAVPAVESVIAGELALILAHTASFEVSPMMNMGSASNDVEMLREDYTQYIPRSHYTTSEELQRYFRTMMWYGRMTFRASNEDESRSAMLITLLLADEETFSTWSNIYEPTNFFVGKSDDVGAVEYSELVEQAYGSMPEAKSLAGKPKQWQDMYDSLGDLEAPAINSIPIYDESIQEDRDEAIIGFRFMGQRFTIDAQIFQKLIYRDVERNPAGETRHLPKALDVPAAMGSDVALSLLEDTGELEYERYPENMNALRKGIASLDLATRTQNLYWSWMHMLQPLTEEKGEGYPMFMQNSAWSKKQLEGYIGSWTELKHDTVLYAKQTYAEMGGGGDEEEIDDRGYVEPQPHVYGRLASLTDMTIRGLQDRGFLGEEAEEGLEILKTLALSLKVISEKELRDELLTDDEYDLIRSFGGQLEHLWLLAMSDKGIGVSDVYENPAALITDVATNPEGFVLQEGTGAAQTIYVVVPVDGVLRIASGSVFSHYEFSWPSSDRLTDEKWQGMLRQGNVPERPQWVRDYTLKQVEFWQ